MLSVFYHASMNIPWAIFEVKHRSKFLSESVPLYKLEMWVREHKLPLWYL